MWRYFGRRRPRGVNETGGVDHFTATLCPTGRRQWQGGAAIATQPTLTKKTRVNKNRADQGPCLFTCFPRLVMEFFYFSLVLQTPRTITLDLVISRVWNLAGSSRRDHQMSNISAVELNSTYGVFWRLWIRYAVIKAFLPVIVYLIRFALGFYIMRNRFLRFFSFWRFCLLIRVSDAFISILVFLTSKKQSYCYYEYVQFILLLLTFYFCIITSISFTNDTCCVTLWI